MTELTTVAVGDINRFTISALGQETRVGIEGIDEPGDPWGNASGAWVQLNRAELLDVVNALRARLWELRGLTLTERVTP